MWDWFILGMNVMCDGEPTYYGTTYYVVEESSIILPDVTVPNFTAYLLYVE